MLSPDSYSSWCWALYANVLPCVARAQACFDPRTELNKIAKHCKTSVKTVQRVLSILRRTSREYWPQHIRDIRALGLKTIIIHSNKGLKNIHKIEDLRHQGIPLYRYWHSYRATLDGHHIYSYFVPAGQEQEFTQVLERLGEVDYGETIPVKPLYTEPHPLSKPSKAPTLPKRVPLLLAALIYASLDLSPLATLKELTNITPVLRERLGEISTIYTLDLRKLLRAYRALSKHGLLGRALLLLVAPNTKRPIPLYIEVKKECFANLYQLVSETWSAPSIFLGKEIAAAVMVLPDELADKAQQVLSGCIEYSNVITRGYGTTIPIEMYDPFKATWSLEPQPLLKHLKPYLSKKKK